MYIAQLYLQNYRNFPGLELDFLREGALIHGNNGIGKTNLLEAIAFFSFGKSFRTRSDQDLIRFGEEYLHLRGIYHKQENIYKFNCGIDKTTKKISLDQVQINRVSELYNYIKTVYFSPQDSDIISGFPVNRRSFIDQAISQYSIGYLEDLRRYFRILKQRNYLLKDRFDPSEKKAWDEQLADSGSKIICSRLEYLNEFIPLLNKYYNIITSHKENLDLSYSPSFNRTSAESDIEQIKTDMMAHLRKTEIQEINLQRTLTGPHLDDMEFIIDKQTAKNYASQGQKRSIAIAARLVQSSLISSKEQDTPLLMFDDVLADLDQVRTSAVISLLTDDHQIFIATPNEKLYSNIKLPRINLGTS
ncbi:MAG: DNA replication/repair protein RecF [Candidatus Cloacimonetes bacterium]|nr:DNA replication/repair protein RecF [Candidatus Cloacimonadota bacterium]